MPVYFITPGQIDLEAAFTFGVSAKVVDNPIGQFGTGLKYAIAVLLRHGAKVGIWNGTKHQDFSVQERSSRGTNYSTVYLGDKSLGFTTHLGVNWKLWQAFRELYSNTKDESGTTTKIAPDWSADQSCIEVILPEFDKIYDERQKYFLESDPLYTNACVEFHWGSGIYYRGILVYEDKQTSWAYNITKAVTLTEDRTLASLWGTGWDIVRALVETDEPAMLTRVLSQKKGEDFFEQIMPWEGNFAWTDSTRKVVAKALATDNCSDAYRRLELVVVDKNKELPTRPISAHEAEMIAEAKLDLAVLGIAVEYDILIVQAMSNHLGLAKNGKIYLSPDLFLQGQVKVTGTILEEFLHLRHNYADCSRRFQDALVDMLAVTLRRARLGLNTPEYTAGKVVQMPLAVGFDFGSLSAKMQGHLSEESELPF